MGRYVVKHGDMVLVWSSIVDAPITMGMTLDELRAWWREEYGRSGLADLERDIKGGLPELADEVCVNRAGAGETQMSLEQLVDYYVVRRDSKRKRPRGALRDD